MNPSAVRVLRSTTLAVALFGAIVAPPEARADDPAPAAPPVAPAPPAPPVVRPEEPAAPVPATPRAVAPLDGIDRAKLEAHVKVLASPEYGGRGSPDDREKAWTYVAAQLTAAGVTPVPGATSMLRPFKAKVGVPAGTNVVGWIAGADATEYVVVSAHFDHLGRRSVGEAEKLAEETFFGADDNASGVAALIEIARALAAGPKSKRSFLVVAFDLEETNCAGSRAYCEDPALPLERCAAFTTMDMLGRSLGDIYPGLLMVMGAERADALLATTAAMPVAPGVVARELGMDFNQLGWSDYVPFEEHKVPSLFFTSGACRDYHRSTDTADKMDFPALHGRAATVLATVGLLAAGAGRPVWKEVAVPRLTEIVSLHALVKEAGAKEDEMNVPAGMRSIRRNVENNLAKTLARGTVTVGERTAARNLALMLFQAASQAR
jgi:hypothetical protein